MTRGRAGREAGAIGWLPLPALVMRLGSAELETSREEQLWAVAAERHLRLHLRCRLHLRLVRRRHRKGLARADVRLNGAWRLGDWTVEKDRRLKLVAAVEGWRVSTDGTGSMGRDKNEHGLWRALLARRLLAVHDAASTVSARAPLLRQKAKLPQTHTWMRASIVALSAP